MSLLIVSFQLGRWAMLGKIALWIAVVMAICSLVSYFGSFWRRVVGASR